MCVVGQYIMPGLMGNCVSETIQTGVAFDWWNYKVANIELVIKLGTMSQWVNTVVSRNEIIYVFIFAGV